MSNCRVFFKKMFLDKICLFIKALLKRFNEHNLTAFCAQMSYFLILSIFPMLIFTITIISKLNLDYTYIFQILERSTPSEVSHLIQRFTRETLSKDNGAIMSISGFLMLYSSSRAVSAIKRTVDVAYEVKDTTGFLKGKLISILYTLAFVFLMVLSIAIPDLIQKVFKAIKIFLNIQIDMGLINYISVLRNTILFATYIVVIGSIYIYLPSKKVYFKEAYIGASVAVIGTILANIIFNQVVLKLTNYSVVYGSLSVVVAFMIWLYFWGFIIMAGAEINGIAMQHNK